MNIPEENKESNEIEQLNNTPNQSTTRKKRKDAGIPRGAIKDRIRKELELEVRKELEPELRKELKRKSFSSAFLGRVVASLLLGLIAYLFGVGGENIHVFTISIMGIIFVTLSFFSPVS